MMERGSGWPPPPIGGRCLSGDDLLFGGTGGPVLPAVAVTAAKLASVDYGGVMAKDFDADLLAAEALGPGVHVAARDAFSPVRGNGVSEVRCPRREVASVDLRGPRGPR